MYLCVCCVAISIEFTCLHSTICYFVLLILDPLSPFDVVVEYVREWSSQQWFHARWRACVCEQNLLIRTQHVNEESQQKQAVKHGSFLCSFSPTWCFHLIHLIKMFFRSNSICVWNFFFVCLKWARVLRRRFLCQFHNIKSNKWKSNCCCSLKSQFLCKHIPPSSLYRKIWMQTGNFILIFYLKKASESVCFFLIKNLWASIGFSIMQNYTSCKCCLTHWRDRIFNWFRFKWGARKREREREFE